MNLINFRDEYGIDNVMVSGLSLPSVVPSSLVPIYEIQGSGFISPLENQIITTTGVVTANFRPLNPDPFAPLRGIFIQDAGGDGDITTSDGIFVFLPASNEFADMTFNVGDVLQVTGTVRENNPSSATSDGRTNFTHLDFITDIQIIGTDTVAPTLVTLPEVFNGELEQYEGMLIEIAHPMTVAQTFFLGRYGQLTLASADDAGNEGRLYQPTNQFRPNTPEAIALAEENSRRILILDDGQDSRRLGDNPSLVPFLGAPPPEVIRAGDTVTNLVGILDYGRINSSSTPVLDYRLQVLDTSAPIFTPTNPRPETPEDVGGRLKVGSFNVLNYFTTLRRDNPNARGAFDEIEFERQRTKIFEAIIAIDPDVLGLIEIENNGYGADSAIQDLINGLNAIVGAGTYAFIEPGVEQLGSDAITVGFIYQPAKVTPVGNAAILDETVDPRFNTNFQRPALAQTFQENETGEKFTIVNNHFKSKGSLTGIPEDNDQGDGQGNNNFSRTLAAQALADWLKTDPTGSNDPDFLIVGDINAYAQEDPIFILENEGYQNLINQFVGDEAYSFIFDGQSGYLDHALASASLGSQVTGTTEWSINADEPAVIDYTTRFNPPGYFSPDPFRSSDHDPVIVGLNFGITLTPEPFILQILHAADQEAGIPALQDAIGFSAVMNALDSQYDNTLKLTSGDLFIAGPFFNASTDVYGAAGIADILIQNELGWHAAAVGNHEFDAGPATFANLIAPNANIQGVGIDPNTGYLGTLFPYLATNLDYSTDSSNLKNLLVSDGQAPLPNSLAGSVVIEIGGEKIGVVAAVTPILPQIANIGGITMLTDVSAATIEEQAQTVAENVQPVVNALVAQDINKIVLMTHLQQFEIEQALASKLSHVDILIGGGSHRVMANDDDILRQDETQVPPQLLQPYPQLFQDADANPIYLINTDANYRYLGQLIVEFDSEGFITQIGDDSGTFATDIAGVNRLYEEEITTFEQVKTFANPELVAIVDNMGNFINSLDGNIFGNTSVYLNGLRSSVRTEETNLGNLTADANLWYARQFGLEVHISVKNGGGIRDQIGLSFIEGGTNEFIQLPPQANPAVGKEEGDISQLDISNSLRFDNKLAVADISAQGIKDLAEHFVARWTPTSTPGQFGQIGGFSFSYDPDHTPIEFTRNANGLATGVRVEGDRIRNLVLTLPDGTQEVIVKDGELQVPADQTYKMVILDFLANGGDGYPVFHFQNIISLSDLDVSLLPDNAPGLVVAGEQDALAEYLAHFHPTADQAFNQADTPIAEDTRLQNLNFREDTILDSVVIQPPPVFPINVFGTAGDDSFDTENPDERQFIGDKQRLFTGSGNDYVDVTFAPGGNRIDLGSGDDIIFAGTNNRILAGSGDDIIFLGSSGGNNVVTGGSGSDQFWLVTDEVDLPEMANIITDFTIGEDLISFGTTSLRFEDLNLIQNDTDAIINALGQDLAKLLNIQAGNLSAADFVFA